MATKLKAVEEVSNPTNGGAPVIEGTMPYIATVTIEGVCDLLFHAWNNEAVEEKAKAKKGSAAKKTDDIESYVYRDESGGLCIPGKYLRQSIIGAAKFRQDPRSPRKSAMDLYKAGVFALTPFAPLGVKTWDYLDRQRVVVQRNGITRTRPALRTGWRATFDFQVTLPEYISSVDLQDVIALAGRVIGIADNRPTYGRFSVVGFNVVALL